MSGFTKAEEHGRGRARSTRAEANIPLRIHGGSTRGDDMIDGERRVIGSGREAISRSSWRSRGVVEARGRY